MQLRSLITWSIGLALHRHDGQDAVGIVTGRAEHYRSPRLNWGMRSSDCATNVFRHLSVRCSGQLLVGKESRHNSIQHRIDRIRAIPLCVMRMHNRAAHRDKLGVWPLMSAGHSSPARACDMRNSTGWDPSVEIAAVTRILNVTDSNLQRGWVNNF